MSGHTNSESILVNQKIKLKIENLCKVFDIKEKKENVENGKVKGAVNNVSFDVFDGEFLSLIDKHQRGGKTSRGFATLTPACGLVVPLGLTLLIYMSFVRFMS